MEKDGVMRDAGDIPDPPPPPSSAVEIMDGSGSSEAKILHHCCGCCCDFRKAVVIVDMIVFVLNLVSTAYAIAAEEHLVNFNRPGNAKKVEDFPDEEWSAFVADSALLKFGITRGFLDMCLLVLSIYGAFKFQWKWVVPVVLWSALAGGINLLLTVQMCNDWNNTDAGQEIQDDWECAPPPAAHVFNAIIWLLFCYPHLALIRQYQTKRMTRDSYHRQKYCCCRCC